MRKLNELEGVALGVIHKHQPCTAYTTRMELKNSPSSHWRASAGSIYPLITRLESEGFISSAEDPDDGRGRKLLRITAQGRKALKAWIKQIIDPSVVSEVFDPLRTRIFFMGALAGSEQIKLVESLRSVLDDYLENANSYLQERELSDDLYERLGAKGGVMNAKSRIELLKMVQTGLRKSR